MVFSMDLSPSEAMIYSEKVCISFVGEEKEILGISFVGEEKEILDGLFSLSSLQ